MTNNRTSISASHSLASPERLMALSWLLLAAPVMICIAVALLCCQGVPVLKRNALGELQFRTHRVNAEGQHVPTRLGLWLARHNAHALPSLLDVVAGRSRSQ